MPMNRAPVVQEKQQPVQGYTHTIFFLLLFLYNSLLKQIDINTAN